jgi:hypothetical protein
MVCAPQSCAIYDGIRSSWLPGAFTFAGPSGGRRVCIQCRATKYALYGVYSASNRLRHTSSPLSAAAHGTEELPHVDLALGRAGENAVSRPSAHASTCLRLRTGECRPRHARAAGVVRASQHPAHGSLYGNVAEPVSGLLAITSRSLAVTVTALRQRKGGVKSAHRA